MKVNFNNLRVQAAYSLDKLTNKLNSKIEENYMGNKIIVIDDIDYIKTELNDLRQMVGAILCVYEEGNDDFKDLSEIEISWFGSKQEAD